MIKAEKSGFELVIWCFKPIKDKIFLKNEQWGYRGKLTAYQIAASVCNNALSSGNAAHLKPIQNVYSLPGKTGPVGCDLFFTLNYTVWSSGQKS